MSSWKRMFGKKHQKDLRKIEKQYDQWLRNLHESCASERPQQSLRRPFSKANPQKENL